ncbi:radical SAM protein [Candidatus Aminicenantes bacterium AC-335-K20]|jgi:wyosine [tRNA(Phe)-imidazoG37] synthetase (radical SAM superfamily)|nr:radical SAM protein [SCandidatus Aminicenantes bacterium Aminicenantia_JdfR_composite]MCP2597028.1 radical SAM protein [Candidatus Aminicenantes bacterium AC-335-G13]MCP2618959.1 radical SAM protein [Candidatus Aminicenantes bacterium AC-335-A11]MCP2619359.1 radical SAM protein [Candidatus Aminicenantes bacterium AC-335-K20]
MVLQLQKNIIYGPINSRRLGKSLGINLMPIDYKLCSFNCIYCQYGKTDILTDNLTSYKKDLPDLKEIEISLENFLRNSPSIDYITFSGNGEPTLHPEFSDIVNLVVDLRNKYAPVTKIALLSNSTFPCNKEIGRAFEKIDLKIFKLDVGSEDLFLKVNRPFKGISFKDLIENLKKLDRIVIQSLFFTGKIENSSNGKVRDWMERLREIKPKGIQIYTIDRPTDEKLKIVSRERLLEIADNVRRLLGFKINVY